jgi:hypothetical protein
MATNRRAFLKQATVATAATVAGAATVKAQGAAAPSSSRALNAALLSATGDAVLPESLGSAGRSRAVQSFATWIAGYRPVSEEMHGYGSQEITYTAADPAPGWNAQLDAMDLLARQRYARGFAALDPATRRDLIAAQLGRQRVSALPGNPLAASHVAVALLAHWAHSSDATDLAYGVRIAKDRCRALEDSPRKPLPLSPSRGG